MGCGASKPPAADITPAAPQPAANTTAPASSGQPKRRCSYQSPEMDGSVVQTGNVNPLPPHQVGTYSNHGIKPGMYGKPSAKINQDRGFITYPLASDKTMALLAVYDGHGANGEQVSEFAMLKVPDLLEEQPERLYSDTAALLTSSFEQVDKQLRESAIASAVSGSTGVAVLFQGNKMWTANVGDSRAVIGRKRPDGGLTAAPLTIDQKPDTPAEQQRILASGGYVSPESPQFGPARVWLRPGEGPGLAMARSIGDHMCKHVGVIPTPEIKCFDVTDTDAVLVLASDGVWEFISDEEAIDILSKHQNAQHGCTALINEATQRWRREEGNYRDDITAIVVRLPLTLPIDGGKQPEAAAANPPPVMAELNGSGGGEQISAPGSTGVDFQKRRLSLATDVSEAEALAKLAASVEAQKSS